MAFFGREGGRQSKTLELWLWRNDAHTNTHTNTHTHLSSWNWAPVAGGGRWASGTLQAMHMFWVWSKRWPWLTTAFNTFATWSLQSCQTGTAVTSSRWIPVTWCSEQAGTAKDLVFPAPLSHDMEGSVTLHITFHQLRGPQFFRAAPQGPVVWNRNVFSEFYTEFPGFGWLLCALVPALFSVSWLWAEASPLCIQWQHHGSAQTCTRPLSPHDSGIFWVGRIIEVFPPHL